MIKEFYRQKGRIAAEKQYSKHSLKVKLRADPSKRFLCHTCANRGHIHSVRTIYITDPPCIDLMVESGIETPQIRCPKCGHFHALRPDFVHPSMGFTWRFMRCISALPMYVPARKLPEMYGVAHSSILRTDREVPSTKLPHPQSDGIEGILVDEKHLGLSHGFVTLVPNARTGGPLRMVKGKEWRRIGIPFQALDAEAKIFHPLFGR